MNVKRWVPAFDWLQNYDLATFRQGDLPAGITVGVMLIPQGMAYAMIAGLPPIYGLYASTIPLLIYAFLGSSRQLAVGPVAMVSLLTVAGIGTLAETGSDTFISLAIVLALMVGLIQFTIGVFRLGFLVSFLSHPVISGFTSAAALIIGLSQLKHLLGVDLHRSHHVHEILIQAIGEVSSINWITLMIGLGGIALIVLARKISRIIPGPLVVVAMGIVLVWLLGLDGMGVAIVGEVPHGLPSFGLPDLKLETFRSLMPFALAIALVSFLESIAVAKAVQVRHKNYKIDANQELIALGLANIGGSLWQSYPVTGGFSRTAVNDQAGAKTGMASIVSAAVIVLTLLYLTPLFYYLPNAILASVIMVAVFGLIDVKEAIHLWHTDRADFWMLLTTFVFTLVLGIEQGIAIGVLCSLAMMIFRSSRPHIAQLGKVPGTNVYRNVSRFHELESNARQLILRFDGPLYFANIDYFRSSLTEMMQEKEESLDAVIVSAGGIHHMDSSAIAMLKSLVKDLQSDEIQLYFTGVRGPIRDAFARSGFTELLGADHFFVNVQDAVDAIASEAHPDAVKSLESIILQTNED